jgi:hypothetical protein
MKESVRRVKARLQMLRMCVARPASIHAGAAAEQHACGWGMDCAAQAPEGLTRAAATAATAAPLTIVDRNSLTGPFCWFSEGWSSTTGTGAAFRAETRASNPRAAAAAGAAACRTADARDAPPIARLGCATATHRSERGRLIVGIWPAKGTRRCERARSALALALCVSMMRAFKNDLSAL